ncbi:NAD(P)/FAD-dependent oxidoreductase [Rhodococcus erythropolis]|uniref:flavin-containing monooxygenase n=1 Tax=Rhodococcus TaxID=1827 RepID=UPI001AE7109E|nr:MULTISPECIES: NAD(P)/FAD-dependent oxidoreductase [Rhodococcus]MBP2520931.1 cation diffusion facilitator CzcD-associated flavoprotein CzcO [Rhodococcus sp. PvP104]MBY6382525.1 NAD(P)/FAD-dependent oxidoreductase [Rhodococcus erythropolis]
MEPDTSLDAIVIGAGFAGIYALHKLRNELGLAVRCFDKADGVGGTWHWNRYPGAKSDSEGFVYRYSFDKEMLQQWSWTNRYLEQAEVLEYLNAVVDRHDLRRDIQLETAVTSVRWDDSLAQWEVRTESSKVYRSKYLITALGVLSEPNTPEIPGIEQFSGQVVHTSRWPDGLEVAGRKVGVIGTGSTGTQFICTAAETAQQLTVFQRTAQYSIPSGNGPIDQEYLDRCRSNYDAIWDQVRNSIVGCGFEESTVPATSVSEAERTRVFEESWQRGNAFHFMFGTFNDIIFDPAANLAAADFVRDKIAAIVDDPDTARKLMPSGYYATRPIANKGYYETFNRSNVSLVSIKDNPITRLNENAVVTADGTEHEIDLLVLATGFDAVDGGYKKMHLTGRDGTPISDLWNETTAAYLGIATHQFPNMFMVYGPNSVFTNLPPGIETQVEWITELIRQAETRGSAVVEVSETAVRAWAQLCDDIANASLFPKAHSWIFGANIPGKTSRALFYFAGLGNYRRVLADESDADYPNFTFHSDDHTSLEREHASIPQ